MIFVIISSFCIPMIILSSFCLFLALYIQFNHEYDENDPRDRQIRSFVEGVTFVCLWALFQSIAYLLWDLDFVTKAIQYKIGLIGRICGVIWLYKFFLTLALSLPRKLKMLALWFIVAATMVYYLFRIQF